MKKIKIGKGRRIQSGEDLAILSIGHIGNFATEAIKELNKYNISVAHYDMRFVKPLDKDILHEAGKKFKHIITLENGTIVGGLGTAVMEFMNENQYYPIIKRLGIPDKFIEHGTQDELYKECGIDKDGIVKAIKAIIKPKILSNVG